MDGESATLDLHPAEVPLDGFHLGGDALTVPLPGGGEVASPVVVRIAGLAAAVLRDLRFAESFSLAVAVVRLLQWLNAEAESLSNDLFSVIGSSAPGAEKGALVGLRRAVFQLRPPNGREWNEHVATLVPADVAMRVRDWMSTLNRYRRLSAELPDVLARESAAKQDVLREIVGQPWFQHALSLASPALFGETAKWLADGAHVPRRGSLVRLAKYAARAAAKTSPYSTFTVSGWGRWSAGGPSVRFCEPCPAVGILDLNGLLHARLRDALRDDPRLVGSLPLRLNPSAICVDGTVRFLGPPPHESIVSVPAVPMVLDCLRILGGGVSRHRADLCAALDADGGADSRIGKFIDKLLDAGLLERPLLVADLSTDPLGELSSLLTSTGADDLGGAIDLVRSWLQHPTPIYVTADQIRHQRELGGAVDELGERAGLPVRQMVDWQLDLWHENAVFTESVGALSAAAWLPSLADLDVVRRVLAALDPALPLRIALGAYCRERFGPGSRVPFLIVYEQIARDLARRTPSDDGPVIDEIVNWLRSDGRVATPLLRDSRLARLRELARIRDELREAALPSADPDGVIRADPGALAKLTATWPRWMPAPDSTAWYLQMIPDGEALRLVVNAAHGGRGRGRSRALHLIREAGGEVPYDARGPAAAEIGGLFGFAPNVRLASAPYEIDYPFTVSGRPAGQRLPLRDLTVGHDPVTGLTSLFGHGVAAPIKALHLGMMAEFLLPPAARLLTQAFGCGYLVPAGVPMFTAPRSAPASHTVTRIARVEIGRVVVRRARWVAPTAQVPARVKGEPDAGYLLRIVEWLLAHDIPDRCFVRMNDVLATEGPGSELRIGKSRKPVYVDFANWYLVQVFERMLAGAGPSIVFEEALPAPEDAPGPEHGPASVTEFIVEISAPRGSNG
jgi:hypothetical protein